MNESPLWYGLVVTATEDPVWIYAIDTDGNPKTIELAPGQQWSRDRSIAEIVGIGREVLDEDKPIAELLQEALRVEPPPLEQKQDELPPLASDLTTVSVVGGYAPIINNTMGMPPSSPTETAKTDVTPATAPAPRRRR